MRFSLKDLSHSGQMQSHLPCSTNSLFFKRMAESSLNVCWPLISEPELLSAELSAGDELKSEETTSNECSVISLFPTATVDESRVSSFVWSHAEPTLYRAAAVLGEPVSDAIL
jgi:hypothetical protein